jgi:hypothetical protein
MSSPLNGDHPGRDRMARWRPGFGQEEQPEHGQGRDQVEAVGQHAGHRYGHPGNAGAEEQVAASTSLAVAEERPEENQLEAGRPLKRNAG